MGRHGKELLESVELLKSHVREPKGASASVGAPFAAQTERRIASWSYKPTEADRGHRREQCGELGSLR